MPAITRLCTRAVLLSGGRVELDGPAEDVVARYLSTSMGTTAERHWPDRESAPGNDAVRVRAIRVVNTEGRAVDNIDVRQPVGIEITIEILEQKHRFVPGVTLNSDQGQLIFLAMDTNPAWREPRTPAVYRTTAWIPANLLNEGMVMVSASLGTFRSGAKTERQATATDAVAFLVVDPGEGGTARGDFPGAWTAPVRPLLEWQTTIAPSASSR